MTEKSKNRVEKKECGYVVYINNQEVCVCKTKEFAMDRLMQDESKQQEQK